ncbi:expansin (peptidoglycan-binding protein) [Streptomyces sp. 3330]|uniref:expansin EXLX1 family cellulose-binding protein n=1 Tax=Streptomyces sp. 3330 TaxID=2817755 RepID=UPI0028548369|nr:expansin EXLX1 family cellulose-binding protein [Streptomyces sp. 3330]MDR6974743.1 expansin (peptidoglycan-binding protein) [Streptomyces sp. 3330]
MASSSHRRPRPERRARRVPVVTVVAVAAVALVVSLVVAFRPDGGAGTGADGGARAVEPAAGAAVSASPTATGTSGSPSPSPSPSTASPSPTAGRTAGPTATATGATGGRSAAPAARTASGAAPAAGRIAPGTAYRGVATSYDVGNGDGACSYGPTSDVMTAAMNTADYETSKACGAYVLVRAGNGASITVRITNECPAPCEAGQLDLSRQAFAELAPLSTGRIPITWSLLSPSTSDSISIRYKTGSTRYWCGIQAIGHRNPLARLEVRTSAGWTRLARTDYNYFLSEQGAGCGGALRLTDIYGERLTIEGIAVRADVVQSTRVQFARH